MHRSAALITLTATLMAGTPMHAQAPTTLAALRDSKRVLLVFAGAHDARVEQQWSILVDQRAQAAERDLVTILLTRSLVNKHDGDTAPSATFTDSEQQAVRTRFRVKPNDFTVILIGKDGGEKMRSHAPIPWQTLQQTVDAMPMRQDEMRHAR